MEIMQKDIEIYRKIYEDAGMVTIPLAKNSKIPIKGLPLNDIYDGHNVNGNYEIQNIGIVTGRSRIVVFDCDTQESIKFFTGIKSYIETAKVKSRRGMHFYYRVSNENIHPQKFSKGNIAIDLKAGRSYVVAPPSIVDGHRYIWDPNDWSWAPPITEISEQELFAIVKELQEFCSQFCSQNTEKNKKAKGIDIEKIIEILKPYYIEGQRQDIVMAIAGIMKKAKVDQEIALEIAIKLKESCNDQDPIQQRFSAVLKTYQKTDNEIAGWSLLEKMLNQEDLQELKNIVKNDELADEIANAKKIIQTEEGTFALINRDWYLYIFEFEKDKERKKENIQKIKICPYFTILKTYRTNEKVSYLLELEDTTIELQTLDYKIFEQILGRPILNLKSTKILLDSLIKESERVFLFNRTGWLNKNVFLHPNIKYKGIETNLKTYNELFKKENTEEQHEFIRAVLEEGKFFAAKIVFAVASLFCRGNGFTVFDIGERGVGKTLTSILAINIFYDSRTPQTCHATKTAMEISMRTLTNMPILFDEVALSYDDHIQSLIFMTASGKGKARANTSLAVNITDINNVIFLTSEREIEFDRLGAFRRFIAIKTLNFSDYTEIFDIQTLREKINMIGAGTDYILYLLQHREPYIPEERFLCNFEKFSFVSNIEKAMILLEKFYNQRFENTRKTITKLLTEQHSEVEKSIYDIFLERLSTWIVSNHNALIKKIFSTLDGQEILMNAKSPKIFGYIDEIDEKIYILGNAFKNFCKEENLPYKTVLLLAKEKGTLFSTTENFRVVKHIPIVNVKASCYCFNLLAFNLKELDGNR
jgi:hypothetical protein